jgi:glutamate/tyrosine decarboxylase-like PLP-dependent enzyme
VQRQIRLKPFKDRVLGYPVNMNTPADEFFAWRSELSQAGIDVFAFNNVGNPYKASPIPYNTHDLERATIESFARVFGFPADDTWGFISHSGTDSNMHGMYMGRTILKGRTQRLPKAYYTREAHYSVQILSDLLGLESVMVETLADGGMDPSDLADRLAASPDVPALVVATVGTTFKGAVDNLEKIRAALRGRAGYIHLDAALFGDYLPFTAHADVVGWQTGEFADIGKYDSIAVSCHKFFGFPAPAGLFVTRQRLYDEFNELFSQIHNPEYIHHVPGTITCSRDAVKPAEFYYFTTPAARRRQSEDAALMLENAAWLAGAGAGEPHVEHGLLPKPRWRTGHKVLIGDDAPGCRQPVRGVRPRRGDAACQPQSAGRLSRGSRLRLGTDMRASVEPTGSVL